MRDPVEQEGIRVLSDLYNKRAAERAAHDEGLAEQSREQYELGVAMASETEEIIDRADEIRSVYERGIVLATGIRDLMSRRNNKLFGRDDSKTEGPYVHYGGRTVPFDDYPRSEPGRINVYTDQTSATIPIGGIRPVQESEEQAEGAVQLFTKEFQVCKYYFAKGFLGRPQKHLTAQLKPGTILQVAGLAVRTEGADELELKTYELYPRSYRERLKRKDIRDDKNLLIWEPVAQVLSTTLDQVEPLLGLAKSRVENRLDQGNED